MNRNDLVKRALRSIMDNKEEVLVHGNRGYIKQVDYDEDKIFNSKVWVVPVEYKDNPNPPMWHVVLTAIDVSDCSCAWSV